MPRYEIHKDRHNQITVVDSEGGTPLVLAIVEGDGFKSISWIHSGVHTGRTWMLCTYDGAISLPIRRIASRNLLPIGSIAEIGVVDARLSGRKCAIYARHPQGQMNAA